MIPVSQKNKPGRLCVTLQPWATQLTGDSVAARAHLCPTPAVTRLGARQVVNETEMS